MRYGAVKFGAAALMALGLTAGTARAQNQNGEPPLPSSTCAPGNQSGISFEGGFFWGLGNGDFTIAYIGSAGVGRIVIHNFNSANSKVTQNEILVPSAVGGRARLMAQQLLDRCRARGRNPG